MAKFEKNITDSDLILVTGAGGFLGSHITKLLIEKGYRVRGTVRNLSDQDKVSALKCMVKKPKFELELVEADLIGDTNWARILEDCTYVIHTASPFPDHVPSHEKSVIKPAVEGTLNVLNACAENENIKRVVITSSWVSISGDIFIEKHNYTERDWPREEDLMPYSKSKYLAERAAWDFVKNRTSNEEPCFEMAVVNPGLILGPLLIDSSASTSVIICSRLLFNQIPSLPNSFIPLCDVRDAALAHLRALVIPQANFHRHIVTSIDECVSFKEWALVLEEEFKSQNYKIPTKIAPNFLIKVSSIFMKTLQQVVPNLGRTALFDNSRLIQVLGIQPISPKKTIIDMANSLIELNKIHHSHHEHHGHHSHHSHHGAH